MINCVKSGSTEVLPRHQASQAIWRARHHISRLRGNLLETEMVILSSFPPPTDGIRLQQPNTEARVGSRHFGSGTLYISESRLSWVGNSGQGFSLEYPAISLHAVSRDHRVYPQECLYMMIDANLDETEEGQESHEDDQDDITEIRFIPEDRGVLDALFHAMSECQALHPDPEESLFSTDDEDGDEDPAILPQNGVSGNQNGGGAATAGTGQDTQEEQQMDMDQFEDAEPNHS